jgi:mRNA interferase HigB
MHILPNRLLLRFWDIHPNAVHPMLHWHSALQHARPADFAALKTVFNSVDWVAGHVVFNVGGNKFRIIADVIFRAQTVFIQHVYTHEEYDTWKP